MSADASKAESCLTPVQGAFDDLRGSHDEVARCISDAFDQLETMALQLFAQHKCLELSAQRQEVDQAASAEYERGFSQCLEELQKLQAGVISAQEETAKIWSEISKTHQQFLQEHAQLHETKEEICRISTEFRALREGIEQDRAASSHSFESIQECLQQLTDVSAESAAAQSLSGHDEHLSQVIEATRQQQAAWEQDRANLEAQLAAERQRSAEQNEVLTEQRRLTAQQQAELAGELKRMRALLEVLLNNMNQPPEGNPGDGNQASSSENAALETVLAQFEMLQRDLAERRAGWHKETPKR